MGLPSISKKGEFLASITDAPATAVPMAPTMTTGRAGFLSGATLKTDPYGKGGVTVKQDVRVDLVLKNKLPLKSWSPVAKGLPVDRTSDNSGGKIDYGEKPTGVLCTFRAAAFLLLSCSDCESPVGSSCLRGIQTQSRMYPCYLLPQNNLPATPKRASGPLNQLIRSHLWGLHGSVGL